MRGRWEPGTRTLAATVVAATLVVLSACNGIGPGQAKARFCTALAKLGESMVTTANLDPTSTAVGKVRSRKADIDRKFKSVERTAKGIEAAQMDVVTLTYNRMVGVLGSVTDDDGFGRSAPQIRQAVEQFGAASKANRVAVGCPSGP